MDNNNNTDYWRSLDFPTIDLYLFWNPFPDSVCNCSGDNDLSKITYDERNERQQSWCIRHALGEPDTRLTSLTSTPAQTAL